MIKSLKKAVMMAIGLSMIYGFLFLIDYYDGWLPSEHEFWYGFPNLFLSGMGLILGLLLTIVSFVSLFHEDLP